MYSTVLEARWRNGSSSVSKIKCKRARKMPRGRGGGMAERSELRGGLAACLSVKVEKVVVAVTHDS